METREYVGVILGWDYIRDKGSYRMNNGESNEKEHGKLNGN